MGKCSGFQTIHEDQTIAAVLLARRPSDACPDALHPEKAEKNDRGKARFFPGVFMAFDGPEALKLPFSRRNGRKLWAFSTQSHRQHEVQERNAPGSGGRGMHSFSDKKLIHPRLQYMLI